jgi:CRP-like cAMP-binding protein
MAALELVDLPFGTVLIEAGRAIPYVYFLEEGVASVVIVLASGGSVEVALIDRFGIAGAQPWFDGKDSHHRVVVQAAGSAYRMKTSLFNDRAQDPDMNSPELADFAYLFALQIAQTAACNRLHAADCRLARWLLMMDDRIPAGPMKMTQEFLGLMLGTRRSTVNLAAGALQAEKTIQLSRNSIQITNRPKLEDAACECYIGLRQSDARRGIVRTRA